MKTKKLVDGFCCSVPTTILALLAIFMPFCLAADVLGAGVFDFSVYYKIGVAVIMTVAFIMMHHRANLARH